MDTFPVTAEPSQCSLTIDDVDSQRLNDRYRATCGKTMVSENNGTASRSVYEVLNPTQLRVRTISINLKKPLNTAILAYSINIGGKRETRQTGIENTSSQVGNMSANRYATQKEIRAKLA